MSEIKSLAAPKASFDRRAVVKGAAWSVPVIAAAIAAPAAAASEASATSAFGASGPVTFKAPPKTGTAPSGLAIHNTPGTAISGNATAKLTITPKASGTPGTGIGALVGGRVTVAGAFSAANVWTITFIFPVNILANQTQTFDFGSYSHNGKQTDPAADYTIDMVITLPGGRVMPTNSSTMHMNV